MNAVQRISPSSSATWWRGRWVAPLSSTPPPPNSTQPMHCRRCPRRCVQLSLDTHNNESALTESEPRKALVWNSLIKEHCSFTVLDHINNSDDGSLVSPEHSSSSCSIPRFRHQDCLSYKGDRGQWLIRNC